MLKNANIILRDLQKSDIEKRIYWEKEETEWQMWDAPWEYENLTAEEEQKEFESYIASLKERVEAVKNLSAEEKRFGFQIAVNNETQDYIGWCNSYLIDEEYNISDEGTKRTIGIDIPQMAARGKGYAYQALQMFIAYLLEQGEKEIYTQTWSGNIRMISLAEKLGFEECKRKKGFRLVRGEHYDGLSFRLNLEKFWKLPQLESEKDYEEVENLVREAFWNVYRPGCNEHLVAHKLRNVESFVKELDYIIRKDGKIVGNIMYSNMFHEQQMCKDIVAFGPISVHPDYQNQGIGKQLIQSTLETAKKLQYKAVMITGNPQYYHRFGFQSASHYGIYLPGMSQEEEAEFFMVKELEKGFLKQHTGVYDFDSCFNVPDEELEVFEQKFPRKEKREPREGDLT